MTKLNIKCTPATRTAADKPLGQVSCDLIEYSIRSDSPEQALDDWASVLTNGRLLREVFAREAPGALEPAVLARFSRLLVDLNRGEDDPTIVMKLSDGAVVPGNRDIDPFRDAGEFAHRLARFHAPYHAAIATALGRAQAAGVVPLILSVHSFTPAWRGRARPWHTGILWDRDDRLAAPLLAALRAEPGLVVGDNAPYTGRLKNDCLYRHGTARGLPHALIEIRQDLIGSDAGQIEWAERYARLLRGLADAPGLREIRHFGSHTGPVVPISGG